MSATPAGADPTAVFGRRCVAALIDVAIYLAIGGLIFGATAKRYENSGGFADPCGVLRAQGKGSVCFSMNDDVYAAGRGPSLAIGFTLLIYLVAVYVLLQGTTGATIGKMVLGVRAVDTDGQPPGMGKSTVRTLMWVVDAAPWCIPGLVALITGVSTKGHRRVGDMAASTYVVGKADVGQPVVIPGEPLPGYATAYQATPYGAPPPAGWGQAPPGPAAPPYGAEPPYTAAPPPASAPQWDEARGTYIQWDETRGAWLQWDEAARTWVPIR